jgi:hypothetical protein
MILVYDLFRLIYQSELQSQAASTLTGAAQWSAPSNISRHGLLEVIFHTTSVLSFNTRRQQKGM